ncbi:MAG: hypothetical protein M3P18_07000 [Actinomycetota bacterium]|nr:hypothetical protein [Actinomycetota bacterium]
MRPRLDPAWFVRGRWAPLAARAWLQLRHLRGKLFPRVMLGLRCDLATLAEVRPAKLTTVMIPQDSRQFRGFHEELSRVTGRAYVDTVVRTRFGEAGIQTLFVSDHDGEPTYAQWLIRPSDQGLLHSYEPENYPQLSPDEVLLEGAYTFVRFRRLGLMNDGMRQLLVVARDEGHSAAITYVGAENVASLRGCANVGFVLDHVRYEARRPGRPRAVVKEPDEQMRGIWAAATAPRG